MTFYRNTFSVKHTEFPAMHVWGDHVLMKFNIEKKKGKSHLGSVWLKAFSWSISIHITFYNAYS